MFREVESRQAVHTRYSVLVGLPSSTTSCTDYYCDLDIPQSKACKKVRLSLLTVAPSFCHPRVGRDVNFRIHFVLVAIPRATTLAHADLTFDPNVTMHSVCQLQYCVLISGLTERRATGDD